MKKFVILFFLVALAVTGCGNNKDTSYKASASAAESYGYNEEYNNKNDNSLDYEEFYDKSNKGLQDKETDDKDNKDLEDEETDDKDNKNSEDEEADDKDNKDLKYKKTDDKDNKNSEDKETDDKDNKDLEDEKTDDKDNKDLEDKETDNKDNKNSEDKETDNKNNKDLEDEKTDNKDNKNLEDEKTDNKDNEINEQGPFIEDEKSIDEIPKQQNVISFPEMPEKNDESVGYNDKKSWWFKRNRNHTPPTAQHEINISQYNAYYLGDINDKVIYLTFDEGYELGYTEQILDVLKENGVKATFFITGHYIDSEPELVQRMVDEGHIVGNHTVNHPDLPDVDDETIIKEIEGVADKFKELTGTNMPKYIRPPAGVYSIRSLEKTQELGYKTIFWSFAYQDWDPKNQPGKKNSYDMVMNNHHNGCIMLLHAVSQSNTEALNDIITSLKDEGYTFASLDELPALTN